MRLVDASARGHKFVRGGGVELEHLIMTRDHQPRADVFCQLCRLASPEIAGHTPLRRAPIDRQQRHVNRPAAQSVDNPLVKNRVAAVINEPTAELDKVAEKFVPAILLSFKLL